MERLAWEGMVQGQRGRKRYKETFSTGRNCKRKRSAWQKIAKGYVRHRWKLHIGTFITGGNVATNKWRKGPLSMEVNCPT